MIDIHTHILPYLDDGAEDIHDSLLMAELSVESGVKTIIATPHSNYTGIFENYYDLELKKRFLELRNKIQERRLPLQLLLGMEIYATEDMIHKIRAGKLIPVNGSKRYLVEFGFQKRGRWVTDMLEDLCSVGVRPIVAHPERYACIQDNPELAMDWVDMGCQLQANKGSFFGRFGESAYHCSHELLRNGMITYIASDAHSPYQRTTYMKPVYEFLSEEYSASYARKILVENPEKYLINKQ